MATLDNVVVVHIDKQTQQIDIAGFNIPVLFTKDLVSSTQFIEVTDITSVEESDLPSSSVGYSVLRTMFTGKFKFNKIIVAKVEGEQIPNPAYEDELTTPDEEEFLYTFGSGAYVKALKDLEQVENTWYMAQLDTTDADIIVAFSQEIEARKKMHAYSTADAESLKPEVETDLFSVMKSYNFERSFGVYSPYADTEFPSAAWLWCLNYVEGSENWNFKQLSSVRSYHITDTQASALTSKNANFINKIAGVSYVTDGRVANGEWIDTVRGVDWMVARIQEGVFFRMINLPKLPMTAEGALLVEVEIRKVLDRGVANGFIATVPPYTVQSPDVMNIPEQQRGKRIMGDFTFVARLAGAVNKVDAIRGVVSY